MKNKIVGIATEFLKEGDFVYTKKRTFFERLFSKHPFTKHKISKAEYKVFNINGKIFIDNIKKGE